MASCSHHDVKLPEVIPPGNETKIESKDTIKNEQAPVVEIKNYDETFQSSLKNIWGVYFKEPFNESRSLDIFIATNRNMKGNTFGCSNSQFGIDIENPNQLRFGVCRINVPKNHSTGEIQFTNDNKQSSHKFYKVVQSKTIKEEFMFDFIKRSKRTPLIFVHGFNVKYQDAILRASQIAYDLKYQGPVILFTWPSGAGDGFLDDKMLTKTYEHNKNGALESVKLFKELISNFYEHEISINLVVHSMGHQVVLRALNELGENFAKNPEVQTKKIINELILNAPDFEVSEFQSMAENILKTSKRITLYCSYNDKAMVASSSINKTQRLGACANTEGIDSINAGLVDDTTFGTGHSYYSSRAILTDVFQVLLGIDAPTRLFIKKSEPNSPEKYYLRN